MPRILRWLLIDVKNEGEMKNKTTYTTIRLTQYEVTLTKKPMTSICDLLRGLEGTGLVWLR